MKNHNVNSELLYTQCGTPDYVAPEIIECVEVGYNGAKVDVWSCGIILYALLVGSLPFREDNTEKLYDLILNCKVIYPSFLSAGATDLLRHLLVRDPAKRASCAEIKRHPWFLVDYAGDDARSLRKPAFYNKGPSAPLARSSMSQASDTSLSEHAVGSPVAPTADSGSRPKAASGGAQQNASVAPEREAPVRQPSPSGRVAAMIKAHEEHGSPVDPSAAFTVVQDRPATPAQRKTLQPPTKAPLVAAALHPMRSAVWSANEAPPTLSANVQEMQASTVGLPPSIGRQASHTVAQDVMDSSSGNCHPAVAERMAEMLSDEPEVVGFNDDASSSDTESVEDYESTPVPVLNLPSNQPFVRHQTAQGIGQHRQMSIGVPTAARHWSDSHTRAISDIGVSQMSAVPMEQLPSLHPSQHVLSGRSFRSGSPSVRANSPRFRRTEIGKESSNRQSERESRKSFSPGRSMRYSDVVRGESPVAPASPMDKERSLRSADHGIYRNTVPWHDSGYPTDGGGEAGATYSDISLRMWHLVDRWRSTTLLDEQDGPSLHMPELRMVHRAIQSQVAAISDVHEKLAIYEQFMVMFGREGLGDVAGWRFGVESEHGSPHSRGMPPADMSSEDDQGWSPTYHDAFPDKAEFIRRRDASDLLNTWMRKSSANPHGQSGVAGSISRPNSVDGPLDLDDGGAPMDVSEMQRMLQHNHHHHDTVLVKEIDRVMKASPDSALLTAGGTGDVPRSISQTGSGIGDTYGSQQGMAIPQVDGIDSFVGGSRPGMSGKFESDFDNSGSAFSAYGFPPSPGGTTDPLVSPHTPTRLIGKKPEMAVSMGLDDVEYYGPDRRGVHTKLKGVLTQIKQRNQRVVESKTQFQSSQEPDTILSIISRILQGMKATVQLKKETKRKLRCSLPVPSGALHATIELYVGENGVTTVAFKRSRQDRGRTDVLAFTNFFHMVHTHYVSEVQMRGPRVQKKLPPSSGHHAKRRSQPAGQQRCVDVDMYSDSSLTGDFEGSGPSSQTESFSRLQVRRGLEGQHRNRPSRAVSDMR